MPTMTAFLQEFGVPSSFMDFVSEAMTSFKCSAHDQEHVLRVANLALAIARAESAGKLPIPDAKIVFVASLSHDILDSKLVSATQAIDNEALLRERLSAFLSPEEVLKVVTIVKAVGYRNLLQEDWDAQAHSIEYRCIQDADLLDAIGAVGIGRCFSFGGGRNRDLFGLEDTFTQITREQYAAQSTTPPSSASAKGLSGSQHFFDKLLRIPSMMTTDTGKAMARSRLETMLVYLRLLADELCEAGSVDGPILKKKLDHFLLHSQ